MSRILIISSNIHADLSQRQLSHCVELVKKSKHDFHIETVNAGAYEIPFVVNAYQQANPFDGYIALGLILKTNQYHFDYITSHISACFTHFALNNIAVGNGIIAGETRNELAFRIDSADPCVSGYHGAFNAVDYLINLKDKTLRDCKQL